MKKLISITLSIAIAISVCSASIYAFAPTDFHNPKCIDLSKLCTHNEGCTQLYSKEDNVCGCKKCSVVASTYDKIKEYIVKLLKELNFLDRMVYMHMQKSIDYETYKYGMINAVFATDGVGALFHKSTSLLGSVSCYAIEALEAVIGFIFHNKQGYYEELSIESEVKLANSKDVLESISDEINRKAYKNNNFLLVSTNYDPNSPSSTAFFAKKDNIFYNSSYINDDYFNDLNENTIKPILARIKNGEFSKHENHQYETIFRDLMEKALRITVPFAIFAETVDLFKLNTSDALQKAKEYLAGKIDGKNVDSFLNAVGKMVGSGIDLKSLPSLGTDTVDVLIGS